MKMINNLLRLRLFTSSSSSSSFRRLSSLEIPSLLNNPSSYSSSPSGFAYKPTSITSTSSSSATFRFIKTSSSKDVVNRKNGSFSENEEGDAWNRWDEGEASEEEVSDWWEEEDETEPKYGDGGDGGGVVLNGVPWGKRAHSIALEVLSQFGDDIELFAFKTTPRGYVYVRLDKLSHEYGCPSMEELENYNREYKKRLDEVGALREIPDDLGLDVSTPGATRLLKVPDDLDRFKDMPMHVCYVEGEESNFSEKKGVFLLESIEPEACIWKLANVKDNRDPLRKGRPLSRQQKDWRLKLPFGMLKEVSLYMH